MKIKNKYVFRIIISEFLYIYIYIYIYIKITWI